MLKCLNVMEERVTTIDVECEVRSRAVSSCTLTPKSVLDQHHTSEADSVKRRRLNDFCSERTYHFSQIQQC